jgi:hypothetical protein
MSQTEIAIDDALQQVVAETFSEMAFLDAIPAEQPDIVSDAQVFVIQIRADQTHYLIMDLPLETKRSIVENIHATPWEEIPSNEIDDCLLEFLNVLGGAFGRLYWGDESRYKLSFPEVRIGIPEELDNSSLESYWFDAYGQVFAIHLARE